MTTFVPAAWARSMSRSTLAEFQIRHRPSWWIAPVLVASRLKKEIVEVIAKSRSRSASSTWEVVTNAMTSPRRPLAAKPNFAGS